MRKSTVAARCLVDLNVVTPIEEAEYRVHNIFLDNFPKKDFSQWNTHLPDGVAQHKIQETLKDGKINVKLFLSTLQ